MTIISILKTDHANLREVMDKIVAEIDRENMDGFDALFQSFKKLFNMHDEVEDKVVYSDLLNNPPFSKLIRKSYQAHHVAEIGLLELRLLGYSNDNWAPKFLVIRDSILHHMHEEETLLLPRMEDLLPSSELLRMADEALTLRQ
jgi:hypothetical protein